MSIWTFTIDKSICPCLASLYFLAFGFILPAYTLDALIQVINLVEINHLILKKSTIRKKVHLRKCNLHGIGQRSQERTLFSKAQYRDHMGCMGMSCRAIMEFSPVPIEGRNQNNHSFFLAHHWWRPLASSTPPFSLIPWRKRRGLFSALAIWIFLWCLETWSLFTSSFNYWHMSYIAFVIHCLEIQRTNLRTKQKSHVKNLKSFRTETEGSF